MKEYYGVVKSVVGYIAFKTKEEANIFIKRWERYFEDKSLKTAKDVLYVCKSMTPHVLPKHISRYCDSSFEPFSAGEDERMLILLSSTKECVDYAERG